MAGHTRRNFLRQGTAATLLGSAAWPACAQPPNEGPPSGAPDLVVLGANVYTVDEKLPRAEAFAVKDGRFLAIGSTADIRRLAKKQTQVIDANKMTVVPGFIDAHCHPASGGLSELLGATAQVLTLGAKAMKSAYLFSAESSIWDVQRASKLLRKSKATGKSWPSLKKSSYPTGSRGSSIGSIWSRWNCRWLQNKPIGRQSSLHWSRFFRLGYASTMPLQNAVK